MAQQADVDLKDMVIKALEKNGSLAKVRALLRANVFLAFEEESEKKKHNVLLDNILKTHEGDLALCIVYEFLEFLNLKNTLFVYTAESRQGVDYKYNGSKTLADKLGISQRDQGKEPILIKLLKTIDYCTGNTLHHTFKANQNCTYNINEESTSSSSSAQSTSQSEQSSDEKNQLHSTLENYDTDTSGGSVRDKLSSVYKPNDKIVLKDDSEEDKSNDSQDSSTGDNKFAEYQKSVLDKSNSSKSTSYVELKPFNQQDKEMLNTNGLPILEGLQKEISETFIVSNETQNKVSPKSDVSSPSLSNAISINTLNTDRKSDDKPTQEYSYDFTSSPKLNTKDSELLSPKEVAESSNSMPAGECTRQNSSSRSSISISDVADLMELSEVNSPRYDKNNLKPEKDLIVNNKNKETDKKIPTDDSLDISGSSVPSLSNLSLDIHSD